eukprot:390735-Pelagomonas_calceolata.AAC.4
MSREGPISTYGGPGRTVLQCTSEMLSSMVRDLKCDKMRVKFGFFELFDRMNGRNVGWSASPQGSS